MHDSACPPSAPATRSAIDALDRLAGLTHLVSVEAVQLALRDTRRQNPRRCRLTHEVTTWVLLAMGLLTDLPIRSVFQHARRLVVGSRIPTRSALCQARRRLGIAPLRVLFSRVVRSLVDDQTPGATMGGFRWMAIDGTRLNVPDTPANEKAFGRPRGGRGEGAFPQLHKVSLVELGSRAELAFQVKPGRRNEAVIAHALVRHLRPDMLLLADREFYSFALWNRCVTRGCQLLWRLRSNIVPTPIQVLDDGSFLAKIYAAPHDRRDGRGGVVVRVVRYAVDDPAYPESGRTQTLITTLFDVEAFPAVDLILGYHQRWEQEAMYDERKTHHDPVRAGKPAQLRSGTPAGAVQELYALSLGHYGTQALRVAAARAHAVDPDRISFTATLRVLRCRLPECDARSEESFAAWLKELLWEIGQDRVEPRRPRVNPRVAKRQVSNYAKKHPHHRGQPSGRQPFLESVVMTI